jgi:CRISPR/Cas system-associated exonuclease Cas4 (RecB family)
MSKPHAWSYSALSSFETCPRRHYDTRVTKTVVEPPTEALTWGNAVHEALEQRAKDGSPMPTGMTHWAPLVDKLVGKCDAIGGELIVERQIALTEQLKPTEWFAKDVWVRGVVDVGMVSADKTKVLALDYKTSKPKEDFDQLRLFAAMLMCVYPQAETVRAGYLWLKTNTVTDDTFTRDQLGELWGGFIPRVARLEKAFEEDKWPAKPSGLCQSWCPCTGCEYNGKR